MGRARLGSAQAVDEDREAFRDDWDGGQVDGLTLGMQIRANRTESCKRRGERADERDVRRAPATRVNACERALAKIHRYLGEALEQCEICLLYTSPSPRD